MTPRPAVQFQASHAFTQAEIDADDALILAEDAIEADDEGPICWDEYAEHRTLYARNGSVA